MALCVIKLWMRKASFRYGKIATASILPSGEQHFAVKAVCYSSQAASSDASRLFGAVGHVLDARAAGRADCKKCVIWCYDRILSHT
jgi:hypothetical protein